MYWMVRFPNGHCASAGPCQSQVLNPAFRVGGRVSGTWAALWCVSTEPMWDTGRAGFDPTGSATQQTSTWALVSSRGSPAQMWSPVTLVSGSCSTVRVIVLANTSCPHLLKLLDDFEFAKQPLSGSSDLEVVLPLSCWGIPVGWSCGIHL